MQRVLLEQQLYKVVTFFITRNRRCVSCMQVLNEKHNRITVVPIVVVTINNLDN
jgi:hypothetical protein